MPSISMDSPVGRLLLRERDGAIVAIDWSGAAETSKASPLLRRAKSALERYFAGTLNDFDIPLAPQGTAFQKRVWDEMCRIPFGETITYGELARRVGSAPRAIGGACGSNPIPIIVPCHRVVAAAGKPGGYSGAGGLDTKAWLLSHERATIARHPRRIAS
ncbi:MAG TPA: methylated-DNA--[protein]-cysteine S-methyltransferase [Alphaproteobacteria bacterium]|nr:methylated-DNA--[protein]-cysteine S-methyltransferase [Alphaproteobacteria bacterium]